MTNFCPICNKDDAIQKVTVIVAGGRSSGHFSGPPGDYTPVYGNTVSGLARLLAPPQSQRCLPAMVGANGLT